MTYGALAVHVRIPLPDEAQVPLAIAGGAILGAVLYLWLVRDQRTGWRWYAGNTLVACCVLATLFSISEVVPSTRFYVATCLATLFVIAAMACLIAEGWTRYARSLGAAFGVAAIGRIWAAPLFIVDRMRGSYYVPLSHAANLLLIAAAIAVLAVAVLGRPGRAA